MIEHLIEPRGLRHFSAAVAYADELLDMGRNPPDWRPLATAQPGFLAARLQGVLSIPAQGWQHEASTAVETTFMEVSVLPQLVPAERAMLHSQGGPLAGLPLTAIPVHPHVRFDSDLFRVLLLRRLRLPLPLSSRTCRCGRPLDCLGHHHASCGTGAERPYIGVCSGSHLQRSWRESLHQRLLEGLGSLGHEGFPAFHGAQLAIDTTLVSPLRADGEPHRRCANEGGVALVAARRRKTRTHPELSGERGRAKLVVLAGEIGGRFSEEAHSFLRTLARAKVRSIPEPLRSRARQSWMHRWGSMLPCAVAHAFASSLLDRRGHPGVDDDLPTEPDVLGDFCRAPIAV